MKRLLAVLLMLATGCATVQRGPMQRVTIETDPPGAEVELIGCGVDGPRTTPATVFIPRRVKRCSVLLLHDGFEPARVFLERRRAPSPAYREAWTPRRDRTTSSSRVTCRWH